jgi:Protein of unknown function (DUF2934)
MDTSKIRERIYTDSGVRERIARRAYYLALQRNFQPGRDFEDWVQAEQEILQQLIAEETLVTAPIAVVAMDNSASKNDVKAIKNVNEVRATDEVVVVAEPTRTLTAKATKPALAKPLAKKSSTSIPAAVTDAEPIVAEVKLKTTIPSKPATGKTKATKNSASRSKTTKTLTTS